ncbi:TPA: restriction endonuclease subunit S [Pseudomonas aeruginosa]|uniref:restriction endonuclease subunit S n=1 Tax=Pseudomonas aeruginosa TaxID=287 RepID=UPI001067AE71|nr:restriction endonuclease subunit S [Pseudomonas aeruginosa]MCS9384885.1 restriction endonuclease subunit S [Pseudomonas aeruginosa]TEB69984.1 restriction endonuclease subunit S [Pseudomonas aeruginosa]HEJ1250064.1 restriction endonuclease subunit S [Pseudomonas aeruginosa]HEJ3894637.1 restriction endonuclease subunit S [Pseudomonas aeruginosa]
MTALLTDNLPLLAGAPNGIKKLRELILELAVRGKLVSQDPNDEPASELLKRIADEKARLVAEGKIKKQKPLPEVDEEALPFELPAGWKWSSLAQVAFVNPRNAAADSLEVSFVPMTFIGTGFDAQHEQEPRLWGEVKQGFTHFAEGDIGVAKITPCFENSKACVFSNLLNGLGAGTTELHIVRPVSGTLDPRYVLAYLKSPQFLLVGETKMTGTAGQKRLPKDFVEANPFPLPPLAEQHRIVAKVDELMALCDRLEARQADAESAHAQLVQALLGSLTQARDAGDFAQSWQRLAEHFHTLFTTESSIDALKQALLQLAVMGKLVPQDPSDEPASELLERMSVGKAELIRAGMLKAPKSLPNIRPEETPYELPQTWAWVRLGEVSEFINGDRGKNYPNRSEYVSEGIPWINTGHIEPDGTLSQSDMHFITRERFETLNSGKIRSGDLVYCLRGATFGKTAIVDPLREGAIASSLMIIRPFEPCLNRYMYRYLTSQIGRNQIFRFDNGSAQPNLSANNVRLYVYPLPPLAEQHRIVAKVDQLMALCDQLKARLNQARQVHEQLACALVEQTVA